LFRSSNDQRLTTFLCGSATMAGLISLLIVVFLVLESIPALSHIGLSRFVTDASWHPADVADQGAFNLLPIVVGTLLASAGAILIAAPLGILSAIFIQFYAPGRLGRVYLQMVELMAGVPSVVFGLWGLIVIVPLVARVHPPGQSLLTAVLILSMMILPTVAMLSHAALASVPREFLIAAAALGFSRGTTIVCVAVPAARSGLATALLLGLVRAVGETMAVVMVCGNVTRIPSSLFDPVRTLTATVALEMGYARGDHRSALFVCGIVLLMGVAGLVGASELLGSRRGHDPA